MEEPSWLTSAPSTNHRENLTVSPSSSTPAFKVILVGEAGVGKTTIFSRLRHPEHAPSEIPPSASIGVDTCTRTICTRSGDVTVTVWDTAGAEKYRTLTRNYFRNTHAALLVFSVEDPASLYSLPAWQRDVGQSSPSAVQFLVGNKSDVDRQITEHSMRCFADSHNCQAAFLISAKTGEGVEEALGAVCDRLISQSHHRSRMHSRDRLWQQGSGVQVHGIEPRKDGAKCCS